jgi:hypothetical protein
MQQGEWKASSNLSIGNQLTTICLGTEFEKGVEDQKYKS